MSLDRCRKLLLAAIAGAAGIAAAAAPPTFQITSVYSNLDGSVQFIVLTETAGLNYQHHFAGLTLTATHNGIAKVFTFPADLPPASTTGASIVIAAGKLMLETPGIPWWCCGTPHYRLPERFLPTDGGTVEFAGVDRLTYASLPSDGWNALLRDGTVARVALPPVVCPTDWQVYCLAVQNVYAAESPVKAIEYRNANLDHYFTTASAADIDALDTGRTSGWQRTGLTFEVGARPLYSMNWNFWDYGNPSPYPMQPVCRFYIPPENGDSHFYSASTSECVEVHARFPGLVYETQAAFYAVLPDLVTGKCPEVEGFVLVPVFRLWNGRADSNHRYTASVSVRNEMIANGYVAEGYGPAGIAFCAPTNIFF